MVLPRTEKHTAVQSYVVFVNLPTTTDSTLHEEDHRQIWASAVLPHLFVPGGELSKGRANEHQQLGILARDCHPYRSHDGRKGRQDALRAAPCRAQKIAHALLAPQLAENAENILATVSVLESGDLAVV